MRTSPETNKIFPALAKVKAELDTVSKDTSNPFFKSKYADLNSHLEVAEPVLAKHGIFVLQPVGRDGSVAFVETVLVHSESGQYVASEVPLVLSKNDMQNMGSAVTYARRYTLGALLSMQAVDDDGEAAVGRAQTTKVETKSTKASAAKAAAPQDTAIAGKAQPTNSVQSKESAPASNGGFKRPATKSSSSSSTNSGLGF